MSSSNSDQSPKLTPQEIADQASKPDYEQIYREPLRRAETEGDPDDRDVAGAIDHEDTPHGREERKHQVEEEAENNERQ